MEGLGSSHKKYVFEQLEIEVADKRAPLSFKLKNELETFPLDARKEIANSLGKYGWSPLFIACKNGDRDKAEYLIRTCGADIEQKSHFGFGDCKDEVTPLCGAALSGNLSTVELLVQSGADIKAESKMGSTQLMSACGHNHFEVVKYLVLHGADINKQNYNGKTCLMNSLYSETLCDFLLKNGADINAKDNENKTALHYAIQESELEITKCLLKNGADVNAKDNENKTALHYAIQKCELETTKCLLDNGADINAEDNENKTALHYAIQENEVETTKLLLEYGVDHTTKSSQGDDALQMVCLKGAVEIWEYLDLTICYSPERSANAQELLGATLIEEYGNISKSLHLWTAALITRNEFGLHPKEPIMPLHESYRNQREFETLGELKFVWRDVDKIKIQSLLIAERTLGIHHPDFISRLENRGNSYAYVMDYQRCIDLWRRALQIRTEKDTILHSDTSTIAQRLVYIMLNFSIKSVRNNIGNTEQRFHDIVETFKVLTRNFEEIGSTLLIRPHCEKQFDVSKTIFSCISCLIYLLIETAKTKNNKELVTKLLRRVINFKCFSTGDSLLHICTSRRPNTIILLRNTITPFYIPNEEKIEKIFPNVNVVKQLLECGANVHARNNRGWTPLHIAVMITRWTNLVKLLLDFGAHIDESDGYGSTLFDRIRAVDYDNADMFYFKYTSLKCLCAKQILENNIPYVSQLPKPLESFVKLHDRNRRLDQKL